MFWTARYSGGRIGSNCWWTRWSRVERPTAHKS